MHQDCRGLAMTAANAGAVAAYDRTLRSYLLFARDTGERLKAVFQADPGMPMAHCLKGCFFQLFTQPALGAKAEQALAAAQQQAAERGVTARERGHIAALAAWVQGDLRAATASWEAILIEHPLDMLALKLAHYTHFYLGDIAELRDSVARVLPAWTETVPDAGFVLAMRAFGLEESGDYAAAEKFGRRAVAVELGDIWGIHAVAHVMAMQGRAREGIDWVSGLRDAWTGANNFRFHVGWHEALFHFDLERYDRVLALYDGDFRAEATDDVLDLSNAIAMLWRLEEEGVDVGNRWESLAAIADRHAQDHLLAFADAHYLMALAGGGRLDRAAAMLDSMRGADAARRITEQPILRAVAVPLGEAMLALRRGEPAAAADLLYAMRPQVLAIGGSHAQRDVFARMLIVAAMKAGRHTLARALLAERVARYPGTAWGWKRLGDTQSALGDAAAAAQAHARAAKLLAA